MATTTTTAAAAARRTLAFFALGAMASTTEAGSTTNTLPYPSLGVVENSLLTTAHESYRGRHEGFQAAARWTGDRLDASDDQGYRRRGPHLVCAEYAQGREAIARLRAFLTPEAVRPVVHSSEHGSCFVVTTLRAEARKIATNPDFGVTSIAPFPSDLKVAPGVLDHTCHAGAGRDDNHQAEQQQQGVGGGQQDSPPTPGTGTSARLGVTHGRSMRSSNTQGLSVELSPGTLPARSPEAPAFIAQLKEELMSESIDLRAGSVWSDPAVARGEHLKTREGAARRKDWTLAAALVEGVGRAAKVAPGDVCAWDRVSFHHTGDDLLLASGMHACCWCVVYGVDASIVPVE